MVLRLRVPLGRIALTVLAVLVAGT